MIKRVIWLSFLVACLGCTSSKSSDNNPEGSEDPSTSSTETVLPTEIEITQLSYSEISSSVITIKALAPVSIAAPTLTGGEAESFSITPNLPTGLTFNTTDGSFSGTPLLVTETTHTVTATNQFGSIDLNFTLRVETQFSGFSLWVEHINDGGQDQATNSVNLLEGVIGAKITPDGKYLYASASAENALNVFSINQTTGVLTLVETHVDGGDSNELLGVGDLAISSDSRFLYVSGRNDSGISVWQISSADGSLTHLQDFQDGVSSVGGITLSQSIILSRDGKSLYSGSGNEELGRFDRDTATGLLTFVEELQNGSDDGHGNTIAGFDDNQGSVISFDDQMLYFSNEDTSGISLFSRDTSTGDLQFVKTYLDGGLDEVGATIDGLQNVKEISISPDGKFIYAAGYGENAITCFEIRSDNRLEFKFTIKEGDNDAAADPVNGLNGNRGSSVSADGTLLFTNSDSQNRLIMFQRDLDSGALTQIETLEHGQQDSASQPPGNLVMSNSRLARFHPSGKFMYHFSTSANNTVTVFSLQTTP